MSNEITTTQHNDTGRMSAGNLMTDVATMTSIMKVADMMASGKTTVPKHLQGSPADCMAVVMQAMQWGMNPFAVAQKTHIVNGQLGYEAQLVNAVVQGSNAIVGNIHYEYRGASPAIECRVGAMLRGDSAITWGEWLNENKVTTKNSPLWKTNPKQQLGYLQVKNWARLYTPGAILGVYSPDEFDQPQPRNMGQASFDQPSIAAPAPGVLEAAQNAADEGVATYKAFWSSSSEDTRKAIGKDEHARLKAVAVAADKSRTIDAGQPAPAAKTFEEIMTAMTAAQNIDALYVSAEWIGGITDPQEVSLLESKFDELKITIEGAMA